MGRRGDRLAGRQRQDGLRSRPADAGGVQKSLKAEFRRRGDRSPWVFFSLQNPDRPYNRDVFDKWLRACEVLAKMDSLEGTLWHAPVGKWATERKGYSLIDVAGAGGWKDVRTVQLYTRSDPDMVKKVVTQPTLRLGSRRSRR